MKGQEGLPWLTIESITTMMLIIGVALGTQTLTNDFVKEEALTIKLDRVHNSVISISSVPKGFIQLDIDGYNFKTDENKISMNYSGKNVTKKINNSMIDFDIEGPDSYRELNGSLCINKKPSKVVLEAEKC